MGDATASASRLEALAGCRVLGVTEATEALTIALLATRLIPPKAAADAAHIAVAAVHHMDFLLTWNCRHIANATIVDRIRSVCAREGYTPPIICTPNELMIG